MGEKHIVALRCFNPVVAHPSGRIGKDPIGIPNDLLTYVAQMAVGNYDEVKVFGDNWPTSDGAGNRDYLNVMDVAEGHVAALPHPIEGSGECGLNVAVNLGSGHGTGVL